MKDSVPNSGSVPPLRGFAPSREICLNVEEVSLGLLMNFGAPTFKEGVERIVNRHQNFASSRLRVNQLVELG